MSALALGRHLRDLRTARSWNLRVVAAIAGTSTATLSRIERGLSEPKITLLQRLSMAFEVPLSSLTDKVGGRRAQTNP